MCCNYLSKLAHRWSHWCDASPICDTDHESGERQMTLRKRTENALAFPLGAIQGATSPKGPAVQARTVFRGSLPPYQPFATITPVVPPGSLNH